MLDIKRIKENPEEVKRLLRAKEVDCDEAVDKILELDRKRRELIASTENKRPSRTRSASRFPFSRRRARTSPPFSSRWASSRPRSQKTTRR